MTNLKVNFIKMFGGYKNITKIKCSVLESCLEISVADAEKVHPNEELLTLLGLSRVTPHDYIYGLFLVRFNSLEAAIWAYESLRLDR